MSLHDLLLAGRDDWISLAEAIWHLSDPESPSRVKRESTLNSLRHLLDAGLVAVGDVSSGGFVPWPGTPIQVLERLEADWDRLGRAPLTGDLCWIANTPLGDERAERSGLDDAS